MGLRSLTVLFLMHLRFYKRPAGRPYIFDAGLLYLATYAFIGCNIPGVFTTWDEYEHLAKRMVQSGKMRKGTIKHGTEFLDETELPDYKAFYYRYEMQLTRYF